MIENDTVFDLPSRMNEPGQAVMNGERKNLERVAVLEVLTRGECLVAAHGRIDLQSRRDGGVWWCFHCRSIIRCVSLLGCIGKLHLVVGPKMMNDVNVLYEALWNIYDGFVPLAAGSEYVVTRMRTTDIDAQVNQFYQARGPVLAFMRKDIGYRGFLQIEHNDFVHSFLSDYGKKG